MFSNTLSTGAAADLDLSQSKQFIMGVNSKKLGEINISTSQQPVAVIS
jgi:hypothetical protein